MQYMSLRYDVFNEVISENKLYFHDELHVMVFYYFVISFLCLFRFSI